ncbi:DUF3325 domain-containing protein [Rhodopseudomonas telluris]|uniref:DUF3325 domain-containing protein n=1 Tax=Rhodopseudomonas telluris TaxID=644215 RepID=A0ABV6ESX5_9BRAD
MIHALVLALCVTGFSALALATRRPQHEILRRSLPRRTVTTFRTAGSLALLIALAVLVAGRGSGLGLVMFSGHTTLAAAVVYVGLIAYGRTSARGAHPRRS